MITTTRVNGLTPFNVGELEKIPGWIVQRTYAVFPGDARSARLSVEEAMRDAIADLGGQSTEYRSLIAVSNKLGAYLRDGHPKVVETTTEDPAPAGPEKRTTVHKLTTGQRRALRSWVVAGSTASFLGTPQEAHDKVKAAAARLVVGHPDRRPLKTVEGVLADYLDKGYSPRVTTVGVRHVGPAEHPRCKSRGCLICDPLTGPAEQTAGTGAPGNVVPIGKAKPGPKSAGPSSIRNLRVLDTLWADCKAISEARGESLSPVMIAALEAYRAEHRDQLPATRLDGQEAMF